MEQKYLTEAFKALDLLNEEVFSVTADDVELKDFVSDDNTMAELDTIIDPLATTEEELQDSYIGKAIIDCIICQSKIYKDPSEVTINEEGTLANEGEECPYCHSVDGYKVIGQVAEYCPNCEQEETEDEEVEEVTDTETEEEFEEVDEALKSKKGMKKLKSMEEDLEKVNIETTTDTISMEQDKDGKVTVTSEPKNNIEGTDEVIAPLSDEVEAEFTQEEPEVEESEFQDIEIDEFDETEFDELGEKYLRKVYENVKSYKTISGSTKGNTLKLEGVITFKSGKQAKTNFVFEAKSVTKTGKLKFTGLNEQFAKGKQAFTLSGKAKNGKLIAESLTYNYRGKDAKTGKSQRLYGRVTK